MTTPIAGATLGPAVESPPTPPPYVPKIPTAVARLYSGEFTPAGLTEAVKIPSAYQYLLNATTNFSVWGSFPSQGMQWTYGPTGSITFRYPPTEGNALIVCVVWDSTASAPVPTSPGWALLASNTALTGLSEAIYFKTAGSGEAQTHVFTFAGATSSGGVGDEFTNVESVSVLDRSASASGTASGLSGSVLSTGTTAATTQANELCIAFMAVGYTAGWQNYVSPPMSDGYTDPGMTLYPFSFPYAYIQGLNRWFSLDMSYKAVSAVGAQGRTFTLLNPSYQGTIPYAGLIVTLKGATTPKRFNPLCELQLATGRATARIGEMGDFELRVSARDPGYSFLKENTIVEFFVPDSPIPWTFEWYVVRQITIDESGPIPVKIVRGKDLRDWVASRPCAASTITYYYGASLNAEDWIRNYITGTCITPTTVPGYSYTEPVYGLTLETLNQHRGTAYTTPPAAAGAPLGQTIDQILNLDGLSWRVALLQPGTNSARMEIQIYAGVSRVMGNPDEVVFSKNFDSASNVQAVSDALDAVTAMTAKAAPTSGSVRQVFYAEDANSKAKWGILHGERDIRNEQYPSTSVVRQYLDQAKPKEYAVVTPRLNARWRPYFNYWLLDWTTSLTQNGKRFDGPITSMSISISNNAGGYEFGDFNAFGTGTEISGDESIQRNWWENLPDPFIIIQGSNSGAPAGGLDSDPSEVAQYTYLPDLTKTGTQLNADTSNPRQGAGTPATNANTVVIGAVGGSASGSVGGVTPPSDWAGYTIRNQSVTGETDPASYNDLVAAISSIRTHINTAVKNAIASAADASSANTAVGTVAGNVTSVAANAADKTDVATKVNGLVSHINANVVSPHNTLLTQLQSAAILT